MATIKDFKSWIKHDLSRFNNPLDDHINITEGKNAEDDGSPRSYLTLTFYTDKNKFVIRARHYVDDKYGNNTYLGCQASSRKPRAGEDWGRGNDLGDGPLTEETWHKILGDIASYEIVKIHRPVASENVGGAKELDPKPETE